MSREIDHHARGAFRRHRSWTAKEIERLIELVEIDAAIWPDIADELGRTRGACQERYRTLKQNKSMPINTPSRETLIAQCDARHAAILAREEESLARGDLSFLIGDLPPPGMSALDKRRPST